MPADGGGYGGDTDEPSKMSEVRAEPSKLSTRVDILPNDEIKKSESVIARETEKMMVKTQESLLVLKACFGCGCCNSVDDHGNYRYMLNPHSPRRAVWNVITMILLVYIAILLPYRLSFEDEATGFMEYFEMFIDLFFILDIAVNFRTGYLEVGLSGTKEILDPQLVAQQYLRGWFWVDLLSSIPLTMIQKLKPDLDDSLRAIKFLRFYKLTRLLKLVKLIKVGPLAEVLDDWLILQRQNLKMAKMLMLSFVVTHTIACSWAAVGLLRTEKEYDECDTDVWYCRYEYMHWDNVGYGSRYLAAMYFSMTIISSVGFGDLYPINNAERALAIFCMILGGSFYGFLLATMSSLVSHLDSNSRKYYERMDEVISYMQHRKFPLELAYRVRNYFKNFLREKTALDERQILQDLSTRLRMEVCLFLINDIVYSVDLFSALAPDALACLIIILKPVHCNEGDYIFRKGDPGSEFYVIINGEMIVHVTSKPNSMEGNALTSPQAKWRGPPKMKRLIPGQYFGELAALDLQSKRTCSVSSATFCDMYSLSREDLYAAFHRQLSVMDSMRNLAMANARRNYEDQAGYVGKPMKPVEQLTTGVQEGTLAEMAPMSDEDEAMTAAERGRAKKEENRIHVHRLRYESMWKRGDKGSSKDFNELMKKRINAERKAEDLRRKRMIKTESGLRRQRVEDKKSQMLESMHGKARKKSTFIQANRESLAKLGASTSALFSKSKVNNNTAPMLPPAKSEETKEAKEDASAAEADASEAATLQASALAQAVAAASDSDSDSERSDAEGKAARGEDTSIAVKSGEKAEDTKDDQKPAPGPSPFASKMEALVTRSNSQKERRGSIHALQDAHRRSTTSAHEGADFTSSGIEITQHNKCISAKHLVSTLTETQNVWLRHVLSELESLRLLLQALRVGDPFDANRIQTGIQICQTLLNVIHTCIKNIHGLMDSNDLMVGNLEEDEQRAVFKTMRNPLILEVEAKLGVLAASQHEEANAWSAGLTSPTSLHTELQMWLETMPTAARNDLFTQCCTIAQSHLDGENLTVQQRGVIPVELKEDHLNLVRSKRDKFDHLIMQVGMSAPDQEKPKFSTAAIKSAFINYSFSHKKQCYPVYMLMKLLTDVDAAVGRWREIHVTFQHQLLGLDLAKPIPEDRVFHEIRFLLTLVIPKENLPKNPAITMTGSSAMAIWKNKPSKQGDDGQAKEDTGEDGGGSGGAGAKRAKAALGVFGLG